MYDAGIERIIILMYVRNTHAESKHIFTMFLLKYLIRLLISLLHIDYFEFLLYYLILIINVVLIFSLGNSLFC